MTKLTYREAYDKIIDAYFKNEIQPYHMDFCFCGTLANGCGWHSGSFGYESMDYINMEHALLSTIRDLTVPNLKSRIDIYGYDGILYQRPLIENSPNYEDALFSGMCAALEVLKEIHRERGENVDEVPAFTKRQLCNS